MNVGLGFIEHPSYSIRVRRSPDAVGISFQNRLVGYSKNAIIVSEENMRPILYIPREDVIMSFLEKNSRTEYSPYKGEAHYFNFKNDNCFIEDIAWSYPYPYDEVIAIKGYLAFDDNKVSVVRERMFSC